MTFHTLVVGYGNRLRGDDGLGPMVADIVGTWNLPGVEVRTVHQLVPEMAVVLAQVERVLFIDAAMPGRIEGNFACAEIMPASQNAYVLGHHETAAHLLRLTWMLAGRVPQAWLLSIAACSFDVGANLTVVAHERANDAMHWIRRWAMVR
jgi:hydrogenase maturation protease